MRWSFPDGADAIEVLGQEGHALEFVRNNIVTENSLLPLGAGADLLARAQIPETVPTGKPDPGLLRFEATDGIDATAAFAAAIGKHHHSCAKPIRPQIDIRGTLHEQRSSH